MAINLFLQRHAHPQPGHPMDGTRQLTGKGKKQAAEMAEWLHGQIGRVDIVITSPFARAMETAEVMAEALGAHIADSRMLEPDGNPEDMWKEIERLAADSKDVLVIGHDPSINAFTGWLCSGGAIRYEHGAIAHIPIKTPDRGTYQQVNGVLHWLVEPKILERDPNEQEVVEACRELAKAL